MSQDYIADAIIFACEQPDRVDPIVFVENLSGRAVMLYGSIEIRELAERMEILDWWEDARDEMSQTVRTR